jgi:hypothetical protein
MSEPDNLAMAIYAARAKGQPGFQPWAKLPDHARDHWRSVAATARAVIEAELSPGLRGIITECRRQVEVEGFTAEHDDRYRDNELARAAACYAAHAGDPDLWPLFSGEAADMPPLTEADGGGLWPWGLDWWKPRDRERDLVRAGALIVKQLDVWHRATAKEEIHA